MKYPSGRLLSPVCFISPAVIQDSVSAARERERHVNGMKLWRLYCRLGGEWVERWGYVLSMAATMDSMRITAVNTIATSSEVPHAVSECGVLLLSYKEAESKKEIHPSIHSRSSTSVWYDYILTILTVCSQIISWPVTCPANIEKFWCCHYITCFVHQQSQKLKKICLSPHKNKKIPKSLHMRSCLGCLLQFLN